MQVISTAPGLATVSGRGETRQVGTRLVGQVDISQWLLVFLDDARDIITPERAAEVNSTLDLLAAALGPAGPHDFDDPGFALPSAMDHQAVQAMTRS
jgi:hydrogenase expression/formation protein HypC